MKHEYKNAFNGVAMSLPGTAVEELLNSGEVKRIWSNVQIQLELPKSKGEKATPKMIDSIPQIGVDKLHDEGITGQGINFQMVIYEMKDDNENYYTLIEETILPYYQKIGYFILVEHYERKLFYYYSEKGDLKKAMKIAHSYIGSKTSFYDHH